MLSQQASTSAALTAGVRLVKPDETVTLFNGRLLTRPNRAFLRLFGRPHAEYDALLDNGIDELIASCSAVIDDQRFSKVVVDLSGGKDSRMVFGAMLQHPRWRERCHLRTVHTPRSSDLRIACGIANMFGADFDDSTPVATHPRSAMDNLDFWRSYFHGQYHRMGAGPWSHLGKNLATINLLGGSGEMLRGFWSYQFARQLAEVDSLPALCDRIVNSRATPEAAATVEPCARALEQELSVLPADSLADRLDLHYVYFRNRTHFGMRGLSFMSQQLTWFPLLSPSLVAAAWCLPTDERGGNKVIRDVLHALHPALATIPFDGGRDALVRLDPPFAMNSHAMRWIDAEARRLSAERSSRQPQEGQLLWGTWPNHVMKAAEECALSLRSAGADYTKHLERARARIGELPQTAFETASKLFAMRDAVAP
jgi:hypothetical protein